MHITLQHLLEFTGFGLEEAAVEVCFSPEEFSQVGGGGGTVLEVEGGYFLFEGPEGLVVSFAA